MSDCERLEAVLRDYVSGHLDTTECGDLLAHCRTCGDCRQLLELHRDLAALAARAPEPSQSDLDAVQARVLRGIASAGSPAAGRSDPAPAAFGRPALRWRPAIRLAAAAAVALALFSAGLLVGWGRSGPGAGDATDSLLWAMHRDASANRDLSDVADSRFTYSNVSFRPTGAGRVALDFDVTQHVQVEESVHSELVRDVLVHALMSPASVGTRLKALSFADGALEPKLREALIFALERDDNLAVRMKALTILADHLQDAEVEGAVLATIRDDASVQMRLLALDYLAAGSFGPERLRSVIREHERPGDEALLVRLAEYDTQL